MTWCNSLLNSIRLNLTLWRNILVEVTALLKFDPKWYTIIMIWVVLEKVLSIKSKWGTTYKVWSVLLYFVMLYLLYHYKHGKQVWSFLTKYTNKSKAMTQQIFWHLPSSASKFNWCAPCRVWGCCRSLIRKMQEKWKDIEVRFEVFTAVTKKNAVFWDVTPCGSCKNRRFGGT
jgi:hypothetical protein